MFTLDWNLEKFSSPATAVEDDTTNVDGLIDPFPDDDIDFDNQTGADWYRIMLSASFGGRVVNGINVTPSCETLSKVPESFAEKHVHGRLKFKPNKKQKVLNVYPEDHIYANYRGRDYLGVTSGTNEAMAFDEAEWAPSDRQRAKHAAILAAVYVDNGESIESATDYVSACVASEIPNSAVESVMLPSSILKRDVISVNKPNHAIFTASTLQRAIVWEDQNMTLQTLGPHVAVDWARNTTIARYIAEANIRYDKKFMAYAEERGVPYVMIKGSWATVSPNDYLIPENHAIPEIDASRYHVPTLKDAYVGHEDDIIRTVSRALFNMDDVSKDIQKDQLLGIIEGLRKRRKKRTVKVLTGSETLEPIVSHIVDAGEAANRAKQGATAFQAVTESFTSLYAREAIPLKLSRMIATGLKDDERNVIDELANYVARPQVFRLAADRLASLLFDVGINRVQRFMRTTFITSGSIGCVLPISARNRTQVRQLTVCCAKRLALGPPPKKISVLDIPTVKYGAPNREKRLAFAFAKQHASEYAKEWAERYRKQALAWAESKSPDARKKTICYNAAQAAFDNVTFAGVLSPATGYMDLTSPATTYLVKSALNFARKRKIKPMEIKTYTTAEDLASCLDDYYKPKITFMEVMKFCKEKMAPFAEDIYRAIKPNFTEEVDEPPVEDLEPELPAGLLSLFSKMSAPVAEEPLFNRVLATWSSLEAADAAARDNGFKCFSDAFGQLGEKARFDDETKYTQTYLDAEFERSQEVESDTFTSAI